MDSPAMKERKNKNVLGATPFNIGKIHRLDLLKGCNLLPMNPYSRLLDSEHNLFR